MTLKGLMCELTHPRAQCRSSYLKSTQTLYERDSFDNLKASATGAGVFWDTLWGWRLLGAILRSPSALRKAGGRASSLFPSSVGTIFTLGLCCNPEHWQLPEGSFYASGAPAFMAGSRVFVAAVQGTPLDHLALVVSGAYTYRSQRTVTNKERVLKQL